MNFIDVINNKLNMYGIELKVFPNKQTASVSLFDGKEIHIFDMKEKFNQCHLFMTLYNQDIDFIVRFIHHFNQQCMIKEEYLEDKIARLNDIYKTNKIILDKQNLDEMIDIKIKKKVSKV